MALRNRRLAELALFAGLAVVHTWPLASNPAGLSRLDNADTGLNAWITGWVAHQVIRNPLALFDAPVFHPEPNTLAYSEHLFLPALLGAPLFWADAPVVLVYNLLVLAGFTLSGWAMAQLVARWTGFRGAGLVAGALFAFNAHLLTRLPHLQALHLEFVPLALYALDRLLSEPRTRHAALLAAAFTLQALCSVYTMVFLAGGLLAALIVRPDGWWGRGRAVWPRLAGAAIVSTLVLLPFLLPYRQLREAEGFSRSVAEVGFFSAGWADYLTTAGQLHYRAWSWRFFAGRTALFPGVAAVALAAVAVWTGLAWRDRRGRMVAALGVLGFVLSFGTNLPGYAWLHEHVALLQGIRGAARWGGLTLTAVAVLAGFGVAAILSTPFGAARRRAVVALALGLVTLEALRAPMGFVLADPVPAIHEVLREEPPGAYVVFPLYWGDAIVHNGPYLVHNTRHFRPMVNGYSGFATAGFHARAKRLQGFPAPAVLDELRGMGVTHVLLEMAPLVRDYGIEAFEALEIPALDFVAERDGYRLYRLR